MTDFETDNNMYVVYLLGHSFGDSLFDAFSFEYE